MTRFTGYKAQAAELFGQRQCVVEAGRQSDDQSGPSDSGVPSRMTSKSSGFKRLNDAAATTKSLNK